MHKITLGLLLVLLVNLLNLTTISTLIAQEAPKTTLATAPAIAVAGIADLETKFRLYRAEEPVAATCAVGATSAVGTGLLTKSATRLLKIKPKGLTGLAVTVGMGVGTLAAMEFGRANLTHLRQQQITELRGIKSQAHTVATDLSKLVHEHGLVHGVITKLAYLAGQNQTSSTAELQKAQALKASIADAGQSVTQLGTDLTTRVRALENTVTRSLTDQTGTSKSTLGTSTPASIALSIAPSDLIAATNSTSTIMQRGTDLGLGASLGLGAGYCLSRSSNPRTAVLLTATSLAATLAAGAFLDSYRTEVQHLRTGFQEIAAIKAAQAAQQALLAKAHDEVRTSKILGEKTVELTTSTSKNLQELATQQALSKAEIEKLETDVSTTKKQVSRALAQTQTNLLTEIAAQTEAKQTRERWYQKLFDYPERFE